MRSRFEAVTYCTLCLLLLSGGVATALAEEGEEKRVKIIEVDSVVECDGEDCPEEKHHSIFIREDGDVQIVGAGAHSWLGGPDADRAKVLHLGGHGVGGTFLGVGMTELTPELRTHFGVPEDAGVMVSKVVDDSPAARGGILVGDVIYRVGGEPVRNSHDLARRIRGHEDGAVVDLEVWREGGSVTVTTTLEKRAGALLGGGHRVIVRCEGEEGEEDCNVDVEAGPVHDVGYDCGGAERCEVRVECGDSGCECTVNGESVDCDTIPGVPHTE